MADVLGPVDLGLQVALAIRLLIAAALGAAIGVERELHSHPAGTRTHLLVSLGSAAFTALSIYGFSGITIAGQVAPVDPSRIAAQIVTGIGFLGAGAILKYGASVKGLTTAASLWVTAAIGMAAGAGQIVMAVVVTAIAILSLGPLRALVRRARRTRGQTIEVRLEAGRLDALGEVSTQLAARRVEIAGVNSERVAKGRYEIDLTVRLPAGVEPSQLLQALATIPDVDVLESGPSTD